MNMTREERELTVNLRIAKARRAYEEAKGNAAMKFWESAANRLYYAAYNAVTALLVANGDSAQTHSGVRHFFGLKFIKPGILPPEIGRLYHRLFTMRQTGDYDDAYDISEDDVMPFVEQPASSWIQLLNWRSKYAQTNRTYPMPLIARQYCKDCSVLNYERWVF